MRIWQRTGLEPGTTIPRAGAWLEGLSLSLAPLYASVALLLTAVALWAASLRGVDIQGLTDLGMVSVLPASIWLAFGLLSVGFGLALLRRTPPSLLLGVYLVALVVMLYGLAPMVEAVPRFAHTWMKVGVTEFISRTGRVDPLIDHNFDWPGFYILSAFATDLLGWPSAIGFGGWAPVFFNLLYLGPLLLILQSSVADWRLPWVGAWFFFLANWVGQDYFSPQALNYFFYLVVLAVLLTWFRRPASMGRGDGEASGGRWSWLRGWLTPSAGENRIAPAEGRERVGLLGLIIVVYSIMAASHQLTPLFTLLIVAALVVAQRITPRWLPLVMALIAGAWIYFMARDFVFGHLASILSEIGRVNENVDAGTVRRLQGSAEHVFVVRLRLLFTLSMAALGALGAIRRLRSGYRDVSFALIAALPFSFLAFQAFGGEMLQRAYLFGLPGVVFLAAALFYPRPVTHSGWRPALATTLVSLALVGAFMIARYGNERMDYVSPDEVAALEYVYDQSTPRTLLASFSWNVPWRFRYYEYPTLEIGNAVLEDTDVDRAIARIQRTGLTDVYVIVNRTQKSEVDMFSGLEPGALNRMEEALRASDRFSVVFENPDATVFKLVPEERSDEP